MKSTRECPMTSHGLPRKLLDKNPSENRTVFYRESRGQIPQKSFGKTVGYPDKKSCGVLVKRSPDNPQLVAETPDDKPVGEFRECVWKKKTQCGYEIFFEYVFGLQNNFCKYFSEYVFELKIQNGFENVFEFLFLFLFFLWLLTEFSSRW